MCRNEDKKQYRQIVGGQGTHEIYYDGTGDAYICIFDVTHNLCGHEIVLDAAQAIDLLNWLLQERKNLIKLAKEQARQ